MQNQPKFIPLRSNTFFPDQRSARDPVPGTVAQGQLDEDTYFFTGKHGNVLGNDLPDGLKSRDLRDLLLRGQERYTIYCTPCHARIGDGSPIRASDWVRVRFSASAASSGGTSW